MAQLEVGDRAPDFSAIAHDGREVRLADYLGRRSLVLFFYPKDNTLVCTREACAFRDSYERFVEAGAEVVGVSGDSDEKHHGFAERHRLTFPLVSDRDGALRKAFGVAKTLGILPGRVTFVIDPQGIIRHKYVAAFASDEHVRQAMGALEASQSDEGQVA